MKDDIYEYLKLDHQKVAKLFKLFETSPSEKNKIETFELIKQELLVHAISEQETFYKALEKHPKAKADIQHSEEEHAEILAKIAEISATNKMDNKIEKMVMDLKKTVEHHVSEEEGKIFREAKDIFSDEEAIILKWKMHDLKGKLLTGQIEMDVTITEEAK